MTDHAAVAALPTGSAANKALLRALLFDRVAYIVKAAEDPQLLDEVDNATGAVIQDILYNGRLFHIDLADSTTPHDGVTCIVTAGGVRYKLSNGSEVICYAVASRAATPDGFSATHLVLPSATGDFAGEDNNVAVLTARGWEFIDFGIGRLIYVEDEDAYYRRKPDGTWTAGLGNQVLGNGSVSPSKLIGGGGRVLWEVENQTTNTPPAVTDGAAYIIGSSPTGDWAGHAGKIAHGENSAWAIYAPAAGWRAYDKTLQQDYQYSGSAWESATGQLNIAYRYYTASATWSKPARLAYVEVEVVGAGGASSGTAGGTASFGSHCSATGGGAGNVSSASPGTGGSGSGGDININGGNGGTVTEGGGDDQVPAIGGFGAGRFPTRGRGATNNTQSASAGGAGGGGCAIKVIQGSSLASSETVTVGTNGANNGYVLVKEYTYA